MSGRPSDRATQVVPLFERSGRRVCAGEAGPILGAFEPLVRGNVVVVKDATG